MRDEFTGADFFIGGILRRIALRLIVLCLRRDFPWYDLWSDDIGDETFLRGVAFAKDRNALANAGGVSPVIPAETAS